MHRIKANRRLFKSMLNEQDRRLNLTAKYIHRLKTQEFRMQDAARLAESKRVDEAMHLRDENGRRMGDMMNSRAAALGEATSARLDRLEKFMYETSGKGTGLSQGWGIFIAVAGLLLTVSIAVAAYVLK